MALNLSALHRSMLCAQPEPRASCIEGPKLCGCEAQTPSGADILQQLGAPTQVRGIRSPRSSSNCRLNGRQPKDVEGSRQQPALGPRYSEAQDWEPGGFKGTALILTVHPAHLGHLARASQAWMGIPKSMDPIFYAYAPVPSLTSTGLKPSPGASGTTHSPHHNPATIWALLHGPQIPEPAHPSQPLGSELPCRHSTWPGVSRQPGGSQRCGQLCSPTLARGESEGQAAETSLHNLL